MFKEFLKQNLIHTRPFVILAFRTVSSRY